MKEHPDMIVEIVEKIKEKHNLIPKKDGDESDKDSGKAVEKGKVEEKGKK